MKKLAIFIVALILISGLIWLLSDRWSRKQLEEACAEWPLIERSLADFSQVFPRTSQNQSAQALEDLYHQIRFDIGEDIDKEAQKLSQENREAASAMRSALGKYLSKELEKPTAFVEAPPADIMAVLTYNADVLDDIAHQLVNNDLPEWSLDVEAGPGESVPNRLGQIQLNRLLIIQAWSLRANGKTEQAWSYLHASTRLADSLFTQPQLISQLVAIAQAQQILVAMRKMPAPIPSWALSWPTHDLAYWMMMAHTTEARSALMMADTTELLSMLRTMNTLNAEVGAKPIKIGVGIYILASVVGRPYRRLCIAHIIAAWKHAIRNRIQEGLCIEQPSSVGMLKEQLPNWVVSSLLGEMVTISGIGSVVDGTWSRLHGLMVYQAGTRSILAAKAVKAESPSRRWPETLSGIALPCERLAWSYTIASDGSVTFHYSKPLSKRLSEAPAGYLTYIGGAEE